MRLAIVYAGTPEFALPALARLHTEGHSLLAVYTQPDRPAGRGRRLEAGPVKRWALEHGLPVCQPPSLKDTAEQRALAALQPDIMIVAAYGLLLPPAVLALPRLGCINIHASLLPRWRGAAPIARAVLAGDLLTGISIMQMEAGLDTGPVWLARPCTIEDEDTAQTLNDRLATLGADALLDALPEIVAGTPPPVPQQTELATHAAKLTKAEGALDWHRPAEELARAVRGLNPYPIAYTDWNGAPLRIYAASMQVGTVSAAPGTVLAVSPAGIEVAAGADRLCITEVQAPGGKRLAATEFARGRALVGQHLGSLN